MESAEVWRFVESYPRLAGVVPAVGYGLAVGLVWLVVPLVGFALALLAIFFAFAALAAFRDERQRDPLRDFGELPTYREDGLVDAWVITVAPDATEARRGAVIRATNAFLVALLACCLALTLGIGRLAATDSLGFG
jgi:phosphate/sulfate permease